MYDYEIFADLLAAKGLTAYQVYKATGVAQSTLSDWKNGKSRPKADKLARIAAFLGVSVDYLLTGEASPAVNGDPELTEYLEELRSREDMRMLFSLAKGASREDVMQAVRLIESLRQREGEK
jgi:transcriptional regulator with XRE-family HTH domain